MIRKSPFQQHVFVCSSGKNCPAQGADEILDRLKSRVFAAGLRHQIRVNKAGCLGQCGFGPMVVVYPEAIWYSAITPKDADLIFEQHLLKGKIVEQKVYQPPADGVNIRS